MSADRFSVVKEGEKLWPDEYLARPIDPNHCRDVLEGSYDIPWWPQNPPTILDIGANIGAFTRWALYRWPGCTIYAYEPQPDNFELLKKTVKKYAPIDAGPIHIFPQAVTDKAGRASLFNVAFNCGEFSLYRQGEEGKAREPKDVVEVETIAGCDLPRADILKMDCEGAEGAILGSLYNANRLKEFSAIMLEYHNEQDGINIRHGLEFNGFTITGDTVYAPHRGELQFLRNDLVPINEYDEQNHGQ